MRMPRSLRRKTTAPAARGAGFTPPFYGCPPPERALARGGGGGVGFARTARQAGSLCAFGARRVKQLRHRGLRARPDFDYVVDREFPTFRSFHLREILRTRARGKLLVSLLPEICDEILTHDAVLSPSPQKDSGLLRRLRETVGPSRARADDALPARLGRVPAKLDNGISCRQYRLRHRSAQTMKSHPLHKKNSSLS